MPKQPSVHIKSDNKFSYLLFGKSFFVSACLSLTSCKKYLEKQSDAKLATISNLADLQLILDNYSNINNNYPYTSEVLSDDYFLTNEDFAGLSNSADRNQYTWQRDETDDRSYGNAYTTIQMCNIVLDNLPSIPILKNEKKTADNIKGSALFFRSAYFYSLAQLFTKPYNQLTSATDLGISLRTTSDYNIPSTRSTLEETYNKIIADLKEASALLPNNSNLKTRPTKAAAFGWLSRTYLVMGNYQTASSYADSCLKYSNYLMDYNQLDTDASAPIPRFNDEVIIHLRSPYTDPLLIFKAKIDTVLYNSYSANDLRKKIFFQANNDNTHAFKGDYDGNGSFTGFVFSGIITDEIYLTRAECYARLNNVNAALADLNFLLEKRYKAGTYIPYQGLNAKDALSIIIAERRKELLFRGIRWSDIKRFQSETEFTVTPTRILNGQIFKLTPNSSQIVLPIPKSVVEMTGMPQNP